MPNTYSQLLVHIIFAVKGRQNLISNLWKDELFKYITGIISNKNQRLLCINGVGDHIHILIGLRPDIAVSDLVRDIKNNSTNFINTKKYANGKFGWQTGFGAFTYSNSQIDKVVKYILNQENHHLKNLLKKNILNSLINSLWIMMKNIYLIGFNNLNNTIIPLQAVLRSRYDKYAGTYPQVLS